MLAAKRPRRRASSVTELRRRRFSQASKRSGSRSAWQIPPALDEGLLDGVLGPVDVPEDEASDPEEVVDERGHQEIERVSISFARPQDQLRLRHRSLASSSIARMAGDQPYWRERPSGWFKDGSGEAAAAWTWAVVLLADQGAEEPLAGGLSFAVWLARRTKERRKGR